jgi:CheY-like chemotaxis protein
LSSQIYSKETQNIYGGTGLGLSITSKLVHCLGGTISLDSELDKFADFTVDLPMNGKYIEVEKISDSLKNTTLVFIEPKQMNENTFSSFPFRAEPVALDSGVVDVFGLNVVRCHSMDELYEKTSSEKDRGTQQHFSLLVHETLYEFCSLEKLDFIFGQSRYSLMTYGANFLVEKTRASHFKSLTALFPATLLESIAKQISEQLHLKTKAASVPPNNGLVSSLATGTPMSSNTAKKVMGSAAPGDPNLKTTSTPSKTPSSSRNSTTKQNDFRKEMKVLYAEDNLVNQKVLSRVLNRYGITDITIVDNGKKAVDISATVKYDCILLDMQMPVMDGMEACEIIMERDPDTIIIFVTAHALDEFKVKAKAAGAKGFISKPFRMGDIDDVLKEIYEK